MCGSALILEVNLGVCFGGLDLALGMNWLGGGLALTLEVKLGGIRGIRWGDRLAGGHIGTYFGSEFGGQFGGARSIWGWICTHFKS